MLGYQSSHLRTKINCLSFFKPIYDTFIIVYPLFNINKTSINKKSVDKINTIATVDDEGKEVEDSDDENNIDEEDDEGVKPAIGMVLLLPRC
jgi:hypothetical protein